MIPLRFDKARIDALLALAADQLEGDWLLIGGAAAATWFAVARTTEDIDLVGLAGTPEQRLALMNLASRAGVPIEAVNSAADFFVRKIDGWRDQLVPLVQGPRATIYRPTATLFLLLKIQRLTATDLEDCTALLDHCAATGELLDRERVRIGLALLAPTLDGSLRDRRAILADSLQRVTG